MSLNSTTRPGGLTRLPIAVLAAFLLVAAFGVAVFLLVTPAPAPAPSTPSAPNRDVAAATGVGICHDMQGCLDSQLLSVFPSIHAGRHEWEASYRFTMQSGPRMFEVDDLDPATGHVLRQVDAWSEGQS